MKDLSKASDKSEEVKKTEPIGKVDSDDQKKIEQSKKITIEVKEDAKDEKTNKSEVSKPKVKVEVKKPEEEKK